MQSQHGARFNHDPWAEGYDDDVRDPYNPVRQGDEDVLAWTVAQVQIEPDHTVIDLGTGTGNTACLIRSFAHLFCVDISANMLTRAQAKLAAHPHAAAIQFVQADLLAFVTDHALNVTATGGNFATQPLAPGQVDRLVSTYAVHHLTTSEKIELLHHLWYLLRPGGRAAFGDLMVVDAAAHAARVAQYQLQGDAETVEGLTDEFYWIIEDILPAVQATGFKIAALEQLAPLSWGLVLVKPT